MQVGLGSYGKRGLTGIKCSGEKRRLGALHRALVISTIVEYITAPAVHNTRTIRTAIIEPHARTLELLLLEWSGTILFFFALSLGLRLSVFAALSPPYPREGILDILGGGSINTVLTSTVLC